MRVEICMKPNWLNQISYRVVGLSSHRVLSNFQRQPHFRVVLTEEARLEKWLWHESLSFFLFVLFSVPITNLSKFTTTCALLCGHTHTCSNGISNILLYSWRYKEKSSCFERGFLLFFSVEACRIRRSVSLANSNQFQNSWKLSPRNIECPAGAAIRRGKSFRFSILVPTL